MLKIERFVNELMTSNCYVVYDDYTKKSIVIDPGSEKSLREIDFIEAHQLQLDYIIISHEHTDHNWGVNSLREKYPQSKMVCSEACNKIVKKTNRTYFLFYYDDRDYRYEIAPADKIISRDGDIISWDEHTICFVLTPGHSKGAMCICIDKMIFTGDTIMLFKPYFNGRDSNENDWIVSISKINNMFQEDTVIFPGHGETLTLKEWKYFNKIKEVI